MVQFNLLPDVKKEYIKTKRTRKIIASFSFLITSVFIGVTVLLFLFVRFAQTKNIDDLTNDIKSETSQIQAQEDVSRKLTVQNQLTILTPLHEGKPEVSRVFDYVRFYSPDTAELSELTVDTTDNVMTISGNISTLAEANRLVDNIKSVTYATYNPSEDKPEAVNEQAYTITEASVSSDGEQARFEVEYEFNPDIFDNTLEVIMRLLDKEIVTSAEGGQ